jgi:hypothetical protein
MFSDENRTFKYGIIQKNTNPKRNIRPPSRIAPDNLPTQHQYTQNAANPTNNRMIKT